jgi:hypothetical protein
MDIDMDMDTDTLKLIPTLTLIGHRHAVSDIDMIVRPPRE